MLQKVDHTKIYHSHVSFSTKHMFFLKKGGENKDVDVAEASELFCKSLKDRRATGNCGGKGSHRREAVIRTGKEEALLLRRLALR